MIRFVILWGGSMACNTPQPPEWGEEQVLSVHRTRMDENGDQKISAEEYEKTLWNGPPFGSVDRDQDGDLSVAELASLLRYQPADRFDGPSQQSPVKEAEAGVVQRPEAQRNLSELLQWMVDTLARAHQPVPTSAELQAAIQSGDVHSAVSTELFQKKIRPAWEHAGLSWPAGLP